MTQKIAFRVKGEGPLLILLHGYGGSVLHWNEIAENLSRDYTVVIPNLSHVYMDKNKALFSTQIKTVAEFIKIHFPQQKVKIAAISFGAAMAWGMSLQHNELIDEVVFINPLMPQPVSYFRLPELKYFFIVPLNIKSASLLLSTAIGKSFLKRAGKIFREETEEHIERIHDLRGKKLYFVAHMIAHFSWILRNEDWSEWESQLKKSSVFFSQKTCLIYDKEDLLFTQEGYEHFIRLLSLKNVHELIGAGHTAIKTRPEKISKLIRQFFNK